MRNRRRLAATVALVGLLGAGEAFACGDKFLVSGRGTRYQRPKTARAASVLIYANPASGLPSAVGKLPLESVLKREGHRSTTAESLEQLAALLAGGRYDIVLAATSVVDAVAELLGGEPDAPVVVAFCPKGAGAAKDVRCVKTPAKEGALLEAIDRAVAQRDGNVRRARHSG
ncbi:MAG TPA: hypothetical protein VFM88_20580 [Vicinamibacteria bacterium]|nr:hypothetical protein [Vicinamibacteria bacterium]